MRFERMLAIHMAMFAGSHAKDGFVFLGSTGDNALRDSGVWQGLYESFAGGIFNSSSVGIHCALNTPHTEDELYSDVLTTLEPLYTELQNNQGWECKAYDGDCSPESLLQDVQVNIWDGRDADAQAKNMTASLINYERITVYLSIPPSAFGEWSEAAADNWGFSEIHIAAEKPFGTSIDDADELHSDIIAAVPEDNLHLVDHWLSFFMNRNLPEFRSIVQKALGQSDWSALEFDKIVVTEYETRGLEGRGEFFDTVGQVRDMVQSHLLQVLALLLIDPSSPSRSEAKLEVFNKTILKDCTLGQYDGFLLEPDLTYHNASADATLCTVSFQVGLEAWNDVAVIIATGKDMGTTLYTVDMYQKGGKGLLTYEVGKEETGVAGIKVMDWPLIDSSNFSAPYPGFQDSVFITTPAVSQAGQGYILQYNDSSMYFPKPYASMISALLSGDYGQAFVTYPECRRCWEVVTASSPTECLDPPPDHVDVYKPPDACGNTPPAVCYQNETVEYLYDVTFACTPIHDIEYTNVSFYQAKCHPSSF